MLIAEPVLDLDEIYIVSDLHLGGETGFQIFASAVEFEALVEYLIGRPKSRRVGLIINGDFVDFLAQSSSDSAVAYFDPYAAKGKLERIIAAKEFKPVWLALKRLLQTANRELTINIGNHDLELALPWVREQLCRSLTDGDEAARARLQVETNGVGVLGRIGNATVLCVHGNDVDPWNSVDQGELSRVTRDLLRGREFKPWIPNGGSKMVVDVINELKRQHYHFVDLLKPEGIAVFDFLTSLGAKLADKAGDVASAGILMKTHQAKAAMGLLGSARPAAAEARAREGQFLQAAEQPERSVVSSFSGPTNKSAFAQSLLNAANQRFDRGVRPVELLPADGAEDALRLDGLMKTIIHSISGAFRAAIRGEDEMEVLREALLFLIKDQSFSLSDQDATYLQLNEKVSLDIDILVAGHTHLERAIPRTGGQSIYYNSGTWARLMQITPAHLQKEVFEEKVYAPLEAKSLEALDRAELTIKQHTVVAVRQSRGHVTAELTHVQLDKAVAELVPVEGSLFVKNK